VHSPMFRVSMSESEELEPQQPLPEPEPARTEEITVATEVQTVSYIKGQVQIPAQPQYVSRLAEPPARVRYVKPSWVFWIRESRGVTYSYDILEWAFRVGLFALGLLLGWLIWHVH
jgi:hypothetical protein